MRNIKRLTTMERKKTPEKKNQAGERRDAREEDTLERHVARETDLDDVQD